MSGGVVGALGQRLFPSVVAEPGGYVLVGMAAFFPGVANAPIGPLVMVCELTQGYGLLAPLMLATAITLVLGRSVSLRESAGQQIRVSGPCRRRDHQHSGTGAGGRTSPAG